MADDTGKDKDKDKDKISKEEEAKNDFSELVEELQQKYPDVLRGDIFEAVSCITDESFLLNYLGEKQVANTRVETGFSLSDVFKPGDTKEIMSLIDLGNKAKTSKGIIIAGAAMLSISKTLYHIFTDDAVKKALDEVDTANAVRIIEDAKAITDKAADKQAEGNNNNNKKKDNR